MSKPVTDQASAARDQHVHALRIPDGFDVDVYCERDTSLADMPEYRHASLTFVSPHMMMAIHNIPPGAMKDLGRFLFDYAKLLAKDED